uniref:Homeobox domain-containing protein n=1 Tax=Kalmanozyma brasiliensis (strain GHG001) TaxID=1365824 RepID=V5EMR8_KALBG
MGSRRAMPERIDRGRDPWALGPAEYASRSANYAATTAEQDYYRGGRGRGDTPERKYPSPYSRDPAYAGRYPDPRMDDPRYSPRHAYPTSPSSSRTAYRAAPHDPTVPPYPRSPSPEPHAYSEPFYPDRRLFFARERIQDPEMDEYYHGPAGSAGAPVGKPRYPDPYYDPYGSPHAGAYPPPGAHGKPTNGMAGPGPVAPYARPPHDPRMPYPGPYGHGDYMPHDPRDMHPHAGMPRMARPAGVMPVPAAHVPPGPSAGIAPPPRRRGKLPKPVTDLLKTWLLEHASHPYPTEDEKRSLCSMTGLTLSQVSNWFINARRRILLPTGANGSPGGTTAAQVKAAFRDDSVSPEP